MRDFDFYVGGIEDAILTLLESEMRSLGVKTFATYSGELDTENLKRALGELSPKFPLVMVSYTDGRDLQQPVTSPVFGLSRTFKHECSFAVICASNDARGDKARRRGKLIGARKFGVYQMLAKAREILSDLQLKISDGDTEELLTYQPLVPSATEFIARIPEVTAYAQIFDTYFKWETRDRSVAGIPVSSFTLDVDSLNEPEIPANNLPGVRFAA